MTTADVLAGPWRPANLLAALAKHPSLPLPGAVIANAVHAGGGETLLVRDPVTGNPLAQFAAASNAQVRTAIDAARAALPAWQATPALERGQFLARIAERIEGQREALIALQQRSNGKPFVEAATDVEDAVATFRYYAQLCAWKQFDQVELDLPVADYRAVRRFEAAGVAGLILPWNFPLVTAAWKMAPALAAGCTVVVKPSELAPLPELALAALVIEAGLPAGVAHWVFGGRSVGQELAGAPDLEKISFTGSTVTGRAVAHAAAERIGRVTLELGGKSPLVICASADLHGAVDLAVAGIFTNAGQMCSATSRILVHESLYPRFRELFVAATEALQPVGSGEGTAGQYGPLISLAQRDKVVAAVAGAVRDGLPLATGGAVPESARAGYFFLPTIFFDVPTAHPLWREELFGPVASVRAFRDAEEALALANDTGYGLAATVISADPAETSLFQARLRAGMVWINAPQIVRPDVGWGGFGRSGVGRELGVPGLRAFQEAKHVLIPR